MKHRLVIVPTLHVQDVWMKILPHLLKGAKCWNKFYSLEQIKRNLILGTQQVWVMIEDTKILGIVLTQIDDFPEVRSLRILYLGGKGFVPSMMETLADIEDWARDKGCVLVDVFGRDKWLPLVQKLGYDSPGRIYRKEL